MGENMYDVAVIGAGIIGLAVAWRASAQGLTVIVVDSGDPGHGASHVAAGMLAPVSEADAADEPLLELCLESARRWPAFAAELESLTGLATGYRAGGTLLVAGDRDSAEALAREFEFRERLSLEVSRVGASTARALEPALGAAVRLAVEAPDDHCVDPRRVCEALVAAAQSEGAVICPRNGAGAVCSDSGRITGVTLNDGTTVLSDSVVVAAGAWSGHLPGIPTDARVPVRPVKGQTMRLRDPAGPGLIERVLRFNSGYIVPRSDGRLVIGATVEDRGFDTGITAWALHQLLRDAAEIVPGVLELDVEETLAGLRPGTPDNSPVLGPTAEMTGLYYATGHYRNGVLLTPITAELTIAALLGMESPARFSPDRFAGIRS
jgi:glycine oxidase